MENESNQPSPLRVTVSIITGHSKKEILPTCLETLKTALRHYDSHLIVTDNCSTWDVAQAVHSIFPDADIIKNPTPKGFGSNHNAVLVGEHDDDFAFVLNDDVELKENTIDKLVDFASSHPKGALFGPMLYPKNWEANPIAAGGKLDEFLPKPIITSISLNIRLLLGDNFIRKFLGKRELRNPPKDERKAYISGAACLIRREYISKHGLFDPEFRMYFEDIDLGLQARQNGYECWQVASAEVMHLEGGSFSPRSWAWIADSAKRYAKKHHGPLVQIITRINLSILSILRKIKGK